MQRFIRILIITGIAMLGVTQAKHMSDKTIDERTRPVGQVSVEGMPNSPVAAEEEVAIDNTPVAEVEVMATGNARSGEDLYNGYCMACHSIGLANAPKSGDSTAWAILLENGVDNLVSSAKKGKNVMPPMGTCADCSDQELKNAIEFMSTAN